MSSLRVRAQNKLLNKLGAAKPSKNVQFENAYANFEKTHENVIALEAALRGFVISLKGFHLSAQVLYGAIESVGGTPENSPEMKQTVADLKNAFVHVDVTALEDSVKKFESRVMRPATGWMGRATTIKSQVAEFQEEKLVYDHYTRKVMALREARDKRSAAGKSEKSKDVEKLVRNEQKLAASTNTYSKISDTTIASLRDFVSTREATLAPILQRVLEFRIQYAARISDESKIFQKMVQQNSAFDSMLGALESFAAQFSTGGSAKQKPDISNVDPAPVQEPDTPVQALSFESFVGEAPPTPSPATKTDEWVPTAMPPLPTPLSRTQQSGVGYSTMPTSGSTASTMSPTSPSSANPFFGGDFSLPPAIHASTGYQTAPVQPLPLSSPSSSSFTPWDDIPPPPPLGQDKSGFGSSHLQMNMMHASPSAPPATSGWESFGDMGDFQKMHQQNGMY